MRGETLASKQMRVNNGGFMTAAKARFSRLDWSFHNFYHVGRAIIFISNKKCVINGNNWKKSNFKFKEIIAGGVIIIYNYL